MQTLRNHSSGTHSFWSWVY